MPFVLDRRSDSMTVCANDIALGDFFLDRQNATPAYDGSGDVKQLD